jgi:hypothetical protein
MSITYQYEIMAVNETARCMEIRYTATGHETMLIGARLPFEGEALENVINMYAPVNLWLERVTPVIVPSVGVSGTIAPVISEPPLTSPEEVAEALAASGLGT